MSKTSFLKVRESNYILDSIDTSLNGTIIVDGSAVTQPVSIASIPLPSGASTLAEQQSQTTHLSTIAGDTTSMDAKITACNTGSVTISVMPTVGTHGNASNNITTAGSDENSNSVDCQFVRSIVAMGSVDQICTITVLASQNNTNFYKTGTTYTSAGSEDFHIYIPNASARYYMLQYSASGTTVTATICGK